MLAHKVLVFSSYIFNPKRMKFPIPFFLIVLLLFAGSATAQDMLSTKAEFKEFAQGMSGRFQSDIKLIHDWPGNDKKKGDRISGIRVSKMIADGEGLISTNAAGTGIGTEIILYNAASRKIECTGVDNGGTTWHLTIWKKSSTRWNWNLKGALGSGEKIKGTGYWKIEGNGEKIALISDNFIIDGKKADPLHDKYVRVNK